MKNTIPWLVMAVIVIVGVYFLLTPTTQTEEGPIEIGSILIRTGDGASWGEASFNGIEMAIGEINENGGILGREVVAVHEDDGGDPTKTISAFRKLTQVDNIQFIIGPTWSNVGLAIKDLIDDEIVISPSLGKAEFNESSKYVFNTWPHDYILSEKLAEYVFNKGYRNIAILGAQDVWVKEQTNAAKRKFEELGGVVSYVFEPTVDQRDLRTDLLKIKNISEIDSIIITSDGYGITSIYGRQMQEMGINHPVYAITLDQKIINNCLGTCDGWEYLTFLTPSNEFSTKYSFVYNRKIDIGADSSYDAVMMIAEAIKNTGSVDTDDIQEYLNEIETYKGKSGTLISDRDGGFIKDYKTMLIKNGISIELK